MGATTVGEAIKLLAAALGLTLLAGAIASPEAGGSDEQGETLAAELAELSGTSPEDMLASAIKAAEESGQTVAEVLTEAKRELLADLTESATSSSSGGNASEPLPRGRRAGDIFYTASYSAGIINHGHVGIYHAPDMIVEANTGGVKYISINDRKVHKGAQIMSVNSANNAQANAASNWANSKINQGYRGNFMFNRTHNAPYNCSQLVWAAYNATMGIDLDDDGGHGVYPRDIVGSPLTTTYHTV